MMEIWKRGLNMLDFFLSPELRKLDLHELSRVRFLVFLILAVIPCGFIALLMKGNMITPALIVYQGLANFGVSMLILWSLRRSKTHYRLSALTVFWMHLIFASNLVTSGSIFSLMYLWSPCLIAFSSLIFGMRGALGSAIGLTALSVFCIVRNNEAHFAWNRLSYDVYVGQLFLNLVGSIALTAALAGFYEYSRDFIERQLSRRREIAARHDLTTAIGELVGHLAHEVNNPLAILLGNASRLRRHVEQNDWNQDADKILASMHRGYERILRVHKSLTIFGSGHHLEPFALSDIRAIVSKVQFAMQPQAQAQHVQLEFRDSTQQKVLRCQLNQIAQVLCHLVQNALEACRDQPNPKIEVDVKDEGDRLIFSVLDNGKGIDHELHEKVFQPFFTTKTEGNALGLSLSVCRGILAQHKGELRFSSQQGATLFECLLPNSSNL